MSGEESSSNSSISRAAAERTGLDGGLKTKMLSSLLILSIFWCHIEALPPVGLWLYARRQTVERRTPWSF